MSRQKLFFLQPIRVLEFLQKILPWSTAAAFMFGMLGIVFGTVLSPADHCQGEVVRIMYVHVPASWGALGIYTAMALSSATGIIIRSPLFHLSTKALAPIGTCFTIISLITGAIWGKPTWGTWWVWDARLTSMLILLFLYLGYQALVCGSDYREKILTAGAVVVLMGSVNVPIIKWSVDWWYTLHQPASFRLFAKPTIHPSMLVPLLLMAIAFSAYGVSLFIIRLRLEINRRKVVHYFLKRKEFS